MIIHGDCIERMKEIPDHSVDAVVTDPPFFCPATHYMSKIEWGRKWSDMGVLQAWWGLVCDELQRVLKPEGHCVVFCNADSYPAFYIPMFSRWAKLNALVWNKDRPGFGHIWRHQHELMIAARNKQCYRPKDGKLRVDVLTHHATHTSKRKHPVEKPVTLLRELIEAITPPGGMVLDPFAGGGSTLLAAKEGGFQFIGIEAEEEYVKVIQERLGNHEKELV